MKYYLWCDEKEVGPYNLEQLQVLWAEDRLPLGQLARAETSTEWLDIKDIVLSCPDEAIRVPFGTASQQETTLEYFQREKMNYHGKAIMAIGALITGYFVLFYDTSVSTGSHYISGVGTIEGGRVSNVGLMQNRLLGCVVGMVLLVIGTIMIVANPKKPSS